MPFLSKTIREMETGKMMEKKMKIEIEIEDLRYGTELLKKGLTGGVIMDVTSAEQAMVAEEAGAVAVMALHAVPADIRKAGGVARMADPAVISEIIDAVKIR